MLAALSNNDDIIKDWIMMQVKILEPGETNNDLESEDDLLENAEAEEVEIF